jgi:hypothetical protein
MSKKELILNLVKTKGPIIPSHIYKEIESDLILTSALLSELSIEGHLKISNVKFGGTPLYYIKGQEAGLEKYIEKLHEKEVKTVKKLKEEKILMDKDQEPVTRVALRNAKDYCKPFKVKTRDGEELFWKYFLINQGKLKTLVLDFLKLKEKNVQAPTTLHKKTERKNSFVFEKKAVNVQTNANHNQKLTQKKPLSAKPKTNDSLLKKVLLEFNNLNVKIIEHTIIRNKKEVDLKIKIPSAIGALYYYCKAVDKKRCNDKDLSSAFVKGQMEKLPLLFLTTGELTSKAKDMLKSEFRGITVKKI